MTMIAAFRINDVPVLMGDFLVSDKLRGVKHSYISTMPHLSQAQPEPGRSRVRSLIKKIHKIGDRLVVGFTGRLNEGTDLMKELHKRYGTSKAIRYRDLQSFLSSQRFSGEKNMELIGWIWEERPLCFHWKEVNPELLNIVPSAYTGSGGKHFHDEIMRADFCGISDQLKTAVEKAIYISTTKAGKVLMCELTGGRNITEHAYGFGAEAIYWDGAKFSYVENVVFAFWNIVIGPHNELRVMPGNLIALYRNFGEYTVAQISHLELKENPADGLETKHTDLHVVTPIYDDMLSFDVSTVGRQSFDAKLWCSGVRIEDPTKSLTAMFNITECSEDVERFTNYQDGELRLNLGWLKKQLDQLPNKILN
jgi:hypothetical protein